MIPKPVLLDYFGLAHDPFGRLQKAGDVWPGLELRTCKQLVDYAVAHNELVALQGDFGSGKTTIRNAVLAGLGEEVKVIEVDADKETLSIGTIEETCLHALGHDAPPRNRAARRLLLKAGWHALHKRGDKALLVLDEAHRIAGSTMKVLKELHEQSRFAHHETLFAVLLVGHRQMTARMAWEARDLLGRLEAHNIHHLGRMIPPQTAEYIRHRLEAAGGGGLIEDSALELLAHRATPLEINAVMWRLLDAACANDERTITAERAGELLPAAPGAGPDFNSGAVDALLDTGGKDAEHERTRDAG